MGARYLIRLDDACHTMARHRWQRMEEVLDRHRVRPIVAVVPDNQDATLAVEAYNPAFWDKVREWQAKEWSVAMHGCTHVMHPTREPLLVPFYDRSEFVGLGLDAQRQKIRAAWQQFVNQGVTPSVWVAPAHSFDAVTLRAVREETSIRIVSDGIAFDTFFDYGLHWVPQQLWALTPRRGGLWTVCLHANRMDDSAIGRFDAALHRFKGQVISMQDVRLSNRSKSLAGRIYDAYFWWRWRHRPQLA
jgi:predicted deacetylase